MNLTREPSTLGHLPWPLLFFDSTSIDCCLLFLGLSLSCYITEDFVVSYLQNLYCFFLLPRNTIKPVLNHRLVCISFTLISSALHLQERKKSFSACIDFFSFSRSLSLSNSEGLEGRGEHKLKSLSFKLPSYKGGQIILKYRDRINIIINILYVFSLFCFHIPFVIWSEDYSFFSLSVD